MYNIYTLAFTRSGKSCRSSADIRRLPRQQAGARVRSTRYRGRRHYEHGVRDQGPGDGRKRAHDGVTPSGNGRGSRGVLLPAGHAAQALPREEKPFFSCFFSIFFVQSNYML